MRPTCIWLTGLPGAGKSTLAKLIRQILLGQTVAVVVIDADDMRARLNRDLGFTRDDRRENVRRLAEVARLFAENGQIPIVACISPYALDRSMAREILAPHDMLEVFVDAPVDLCRRRDPKGLYAKAASGQIRGLVGFDVDFETPTTDEALRVSTGLHTAHACAESVVARLSAMQKLDTVLPLHAL